MFKNFEIDKTMIVCDLDGTLLNENREVSPKNKVALERFVGKGGHFTIATGRNIMGAKKIFDVVPVNMPVILLNGSLIYDYSKSEILYECMLGDNARDIVLQVANDFLDIGIEIFNRQGISLIRENEITQNHILRETFSEHIMKPDEVSKPWYKIMFAGNFDRLCELEKYLAIYQDNFNYVFTESTMIDIIDKKASKGAALEKLASMCKFELSDVIAIGDNMNDIEMIKTAGIGVAVANAHQSVINAADFCGKNHNDDAISHVIELLET